MVFSSIPVYLDPPNWQQQTNHQSGVGCENTPPPPLPPPLPVTGCGSGSIRPSLMGDRPRLAKMPQPEAALKCPRCESTNTKFCYYNNYNSSQPRHFCKSCRRYWTRGGALRNVPIGGGSRRNKRSKAGNGLKSPLMEKKTASSSTATVSSSSCTSDMVGHLIPPESSQLQLFPYHHLSDFSIGNVSMSFAGIQPPTVGEDSAIFPITTDSSGGAGVRGDPMFSCAITENWRLQQVQQFPFLSNMENSNGLYALGSYNEGGAERPNYQLHRFSKPLASGVSRLVTEKMEENQGFNFPRNFLGVQGNDQFWGGNNAWNDLSGFSPSSTSHL